MGGFRCVGFTKLLDKAPIELDEVPSFAAFAAELIQRGHDRRADKDGEGFSPVTYRKGATRGKAGITFAYALSFDIEHLTPARLREIQAVLASVEHLIYTTHRHTPESPRVRVIVPLSQRVAPAFYDQLWSAVAELLGPEVDQNAKDVSRFSYLPSAPPDAPGHFIEYRDPALGGNVYTVDPLEILGITQAQLDAATVSTTPAAPQPAPPPNNVVPLPKKLATKGRPTQADLVGRLRKVALTNRQAKPQIDALLAGQPFATAGARDATLYSLASTAAFIAPEAEVDDLIVLFEPSLAAMAASSTPDNPSPSVENAREKLARALSQRRQRFLEEENFLFSNAPPAATNTASAPSAPSASSANAAPRPPEELVTLALDGDDGPGERFEPYSEEELATFFPKAGATDVEDFKRRLIIIHGSSYHVFGGTRGRYLAPVGKDQLLTTVRRDWVPLIRAGLVDLEYDVMTKNGPQTKQKSLQMLLNEYASVARSGVMQIGEVEGRYDPAAHQIIEACAYVRRDLVPTFDPQIDTWLKLLGGDEAPKLLDWVATVTRTDRQSCALLLEGAPSAGKTMLALGLAKLWGKHVQPTELRDALSEFPEPLTRCPLILADEEIPGRQRSAALRALIGTSSRSLNRKNLAKVTLLGAIRMILTANSDKLLGLGDEEFTTNDLDAVASRFLHIQAGPEASRYLESLGGRRGTDGWVEGANKIAAHAAWLAINRPVQEGDRFLVEGSLGRMVRELAVRSQGAVAIMEWLIGCMADEARTLTKEGKGDLVRFGNGELLVSFDAVRVPSSWRVYRDNVRQPDTTELSRALENLSNGTKWLGSKGAQICYHRVQAALVYAWSQRHGVGDPLQLQRLVDRQVSPVAPVNQNPAAATSGPASVAGAKNVTPGQSAAPENSADSKTGVADGSGT